MSTYQESLFLLRLRDNAKTFTSYAGLPTPSPDLLDAVINIFQAIDCCQEFGNIKFHLRTLCFGYIPTVPHQEVSTQFLQRRVLSCFFFILQSEANWAGIQKLMSMLEGTSYAGYLGSQENLSILTELNLMAANMLELSTPYEFVELVLAKKFRKAISHIIDLSLTTIQVSNMSAEEIFVGSCMYAGDVYPISPLGDSLSLNFEAAKLAGAQVRDLLKETIETIEQ